MIKLLLPLCDDFDLERGMTQTDSDSDDDSSCDTDEADDIGSDNEYGIPRNGFFSCAVALAAPRGNATATPHAAATAASTTAAASE